jgi:hypothetical protein
LVYAEREKSQAKLTYGTIPANTGGQDWKKERGRKAPLFSEVRLISRPTAQTRKIFVILNRIKRKPDRRGWA